MIALCQYTLHGGEKCKQAALKDGPYCRHHQILRKAVAAASPEFKDPYLLRRRLPFVFPEDRASIQINYFVLLQALNDRRVDAKTAGIMMRVLKATDANLKKGPLDESGKSTDRQPVVDTASQVNEDTIQQPVKLSQDTPVESGPQPTGEEASQPDRAEVEQPASEAVAQPDCKPHSDSAPQTESVPHLQLDAETEARLSEIYRLHSNEPNYADRIRDVIITSQLPTINPAPPQ